MKRCTQQLAAPLAYAADAEIAQLFDSIKWASKPAEKLARLQERLMNRTLDEVRRWVQNTNQQHRVPQP